MRRGSRQSTPTVAEVTPLGVPAYDGVGEQLPGIPEGEPDAAGQRCTPAGSLARYICP